MDRFKFKLVVLALIFCSLLSCGKKDGEESKVEITVSPGSPIVLLDSSSNPYFDMRFSVQNDSSKTVTLLAFNFDVKKATSMSDGTAASFSAGSFDGSITVGDNSCAYAFETFVPYGPGEGGRLTLHDAVLEGDGCPNGFTATDVRFRLVLTGGKPEDDNYIYTVEAEAIGMFGDLSAPEGRFIKRFTFQTE